MATQYAKMTDFTVFGLTSATISALDAGIQLRHLSAASDFIDSYLNEKFNLPLLSWGDGLIQKCCEIAAGSMLMIRGYDPEDASDKSIIDRYNVALTWLEAIKNGEITPIVKDSSPMQGEPYGPNTLQMSTSDVTTQSQTGSLTQETLDNAGGSVFVGQPRQRGWR